MPPFKDTMFCKIKIKFPLASSLCPQSFYHSFPSINTKTSAEAPFSIPQHSLAFQRTTNSQTDENTSRHNLGHPKTTEKSTPNGGSHIAVKKKVVHNLSIPLAHATFVHHDDVLPLDTIKGEDIV
jgi:hypothetical protein